MAVKPSLIVARVRQWLGGQFRLSTRRPQTLWGYPVGDDEQHDADGSGGKASDRSQRGIALLIAIMLISIMVMFTTDLIVSSQVGLEVTASHRDNVKAEYMAKSGQNLAGFLLVGDMALDLFLASPQSPMKTAPSDSLGDMWGALNGIPIGGGTAEMMMKTQKSFELNSVTDDDVMTQLKLFDGEFTLNVSDESGKINVNFCAQGRCTEVIAMLQALFSCPAEKAFLEEKKVQPKELAFRIKDWVDNDTKAESDSGYSDENDPYSRKTPPYKTKNAPFDSLNELKMVEGWDDDVHRVFAPYITLWPFQNSGTDKPKINLNTASKELLNCLFPQSKADCNEKSASVFKSRDKDKSGLVGGKSDIATVLKETFCYVPGVGSENETGNKANWFQVRSSVFRIEAVGEVGNQRRTVTAIVERRVPDKKDIKSSTQMLFWRFE